MPMDFLMTMQKVEDTIAFAMQQPMLEWEARECWKRAQQFHYLEKQFVGSLPDEYLELFTVPLKSPDGDTLDFSLKHLCVIGDLSRLIDIAEINDKPELLDEIEEALDNNAPLPSSSSKFGRGISQMIMNEKRISGLD